MTEPLQPQRGARGLFARGNRIATGNPRIKCLGELQQALRTAVTADELREVVRHLRVLALGGDVQAARVLLDRIAGRPREEVATAEIGLPAVVDAASLATALRTIAAATAAGDLEPAAASQLAGVGRATGEALLLEALEQRLARLEAGR